ncbi:MAG TPA: hypothetical protein VK665_18420 [Candidatus Elarobacter sp.]|nr:hypothetical protein [Candidatus Elarobacter sp.]
MKVPLDVGAPSVAALHGPMNETERFETGAEFCVTVTVAVSFVPVNVIGGASCAPPETNEPV